MKIVLQKNRLVARVIHKSQTFTKPVNFMNNKKFNLKKFIRLSSVNLDNSINKPVNSQ